MRNSEWQAVVLCGGTGSRMTELTDHIPKCMLPVAGIPIFWYPLNFLQRNSINDIILIVNEKHLTEVKLLLTREGLPPLVGLNIDIVACGNDGYGTADVLRHLGAKIKKDFIVVSGDFVSDMSLEPVFSLHRAENSTITCVFADNIVTGPVPGPKIRRSKGRDLIALSPLNQLLFMSSEEDVDESIQLDSSLLSKYKIFNITAKYNDCHLYLMKKWVLEVLSKERNMSSIKADLIPYFLERQYCMIEPDIAAHLNPDELLNLANKFSCGFSNIETTSKLRCFAYLLTPENGNIIAHANNLGAYFEVNKAVIRFLWTRFSNLFPVGLKTENFGGSITASESYISASAYFAEGLTGEGGISRGEKTTVKRSVIGANTKIGIGARITNSLIMGWCSIGFGVHISNSILCNEVIVEDGAEITSSIIANRQKIPSNCKVQNELIAPVDEMDLEERCSD